MFGKKNKAKVKVKTAKGGGPIRKVKAMIGVGAMLSFLKWVGADAWLPPDLVKPFAEFAVEGVSLLLLAVAYWTRPSDEDGVEVEG